MWSTIQMIIEPIAVYVVMPILVLGWAACLFEPGWKLISLWRTSKLPLVGVEKQDAPALALAGKAAERRALEQAIPLLIAAEGTAEQVGAIAPRGARDFTFILMYTAIFFAGLATWAVSFVLTGLPVWPEMVESIRLIGIVQMLVPLAGIPTALFGVISGIPGLADADDTLKNPLIASRYYHEAVNILRDAKVEVGSNLDAETPAFVDPAQQVYHSNMGLWAAIALGPRILLSGVRLSRLGPDTKALHHAARDLRMATEEALAKLETPAAPAHIPLAERIPMVA